MKDRASLIMLIADLRRQKKMLFHSNPFAPSKMPDLDSKVHFFDSEIRRIEQQLRAVT